MPPVLRQTLLVLLLALVPAVARAQPAPFEIRCLRFTGQVGLTIFPNTRGILTSSMPVHVHDVLTTDSNSEVLLELPDKTLLWVAPNTRIGFDVNASRPLRPVIHYGTCVLDVVQDQKDLQVLLIPGKVNIPQGVALIELLPSKTPGQEPVQNIAVAAGTIDYQRGILSKDRIAIEAGQECLSAQQPKSTGIMPAPMHTTPMSPDTAKEIAAIRQLMAAYRH